jgi:segregation and condensation protein B
MMDESNVKNILEAALLCVQHPMSMHHISKIFDDEINENILKELLGEIKKDWLNKGLELVQSALGWRFQSRLEIKKFLERLNSEKVFKYSRTVLETLTIIVHRQPVTRGDIEDIRGVAVNSQIIKILEDRGWVEIIGHKETPGRPGLYATTRQFLDDFGLFSLDDFLLEQTHTSNSCLHKYEQ